MKIKFQVRKEYEEHGRRMAWVKSHKKKNKNKNNPTLLENARKNIFCERQAIFIQTIKFQVRKEYMKIKTILTFFIQTILTFFFIKTNN